MECRGCRAAVWAGTKAERVSRKGSSGVLWGSGKERALWDSENFLENLGGVSGDTLKE